MDYNNDPDIINSISGPNPPFKRFNKETIFYTEMDFSVATVNPYYCFIDSSLYAEFADNDLRKQAFFAPNVGLQKFKGNYTSNKYTYFSGLATDEMYMSQG